MHIAPVLAATLICAAAVMQRAAAQPARYADVETVYPDMPLHSDRFGESIDVDGQTLVVTRGDGNPADGIQRRAVLVYRRAAGAWVFEAMLAPYDKIPVDLQDARVAAGGAFVVIGAPRSGIDGEGRAFLWERSDGTGAWRQVRVLKSSQPSRFAAFGSAVAIDANTLVVGSPFESGPAQRGDGAAHVFQRESDGWRHARTINPPAQPGVISGFGAAVAIDASRILVGAPFSAAPGGPGAAGSALVFSRNQGGAGRWGQIARLDSPVPQEGAQCGRAVGLSAHRAAVGCDAVRETWVHRIGSAALPARLADPDGMRFFGTALAFAGDRLAVAAAGLRTDIQSEVAVYDCPDARPLRCRRHDTLSQGLDHHGFGRSVAVDAAGRIAVGYDDEGSAFLEGGAVFIYSESEAP